MLGAVWGASFLLLRIASPEFGPLALISLRLSVSALVLSPIIFLRREFPVVLANWRLFLWAGVFTSAFPFTLLSIVSLSMSAGNTSLLNATVPMYSAIITWLWLKEKLNSIGIAGLVLGFIGVFVLASPEGGEYRTLLVPVLAATLGTICYAYGSCFTNLYLQGFKPITVTTGSQFYAALFMLPFGILFWPDSAPSTLSWISAVSLGIFCTAMALIMFFRLLNQIGVTKSVSVAYLIPVFGILWGAIFLHEVLTLKMIFGGALILLGVFLTTRQPRVKVAA